MGRAKFNFIIFIVIVYTVTGIGDWSFNSVKINIKYKQHRDKKKGRKHNISVLK